MEWLRRLDERILGPRRPDSVPAMRSAFSLAVLGVVAVLLLALVTGRGDLLVAGGGFLGVLLA